MMPRELRNHGDAGHGPAVRTIQSLAFLVGMGVSLVLSLVFAIQSVGRVPRTVPPAARSHVFSGEQINPNEAPVPSLMRLPQIGLARARAIVTHCDQVRSRPGRWPPFRAADDLQEIKGIGPATVAEIRPWLAFGDLLPESPGPAGP